jgi:hypothetical protein
MDLKRNSHKVSTHISHVGDGFSLLISVAGMFFKLIFQGITAAIRERSQAFNPLTPARATLQTQPYPRRKLR